MSQPHLGNPSSRQEQSPRGGVSLHRGLRGVAAASVGRNHRRPPLPERGWPLTRRYWASGFFYSRGGTHRRPAPPAKHRGRLVGTWLPSGGGVTTPRAILFLTMGSVLLVPGFAAAQQRPCTVVVITDCVSARGGGDGFGATIVSPGGRGNRVEGDVAKTSGSGIRNAPPKARPTVVTERALVPTCTGNEPGVTDLLCSAATDLCANEGEVACGSMCGRWTKRESQRLGRGNSSHRSSAAVRRNPR